METEREVRSDVSLILLAHMAKLLIKRFYELCAEMRRARREPPTHRRAAVAYQKKNTE